MRVLPLLLALVSAVSPVQKVVQLLDELKVTVQTDLKNEAAAFEEYSEYCDDEITQTGFAIKTGSSKIEEYSAVIEEAAGKIQSYGAAIERDGNGIAEKETELANAQEVRNNENKDFKAAEKELIDTIDTLARASVVLKRELSFAQGATIPKKTLNMLNGLKAIVQTFDTDSAREVSAFLQSQADNELSLHQPQATTRSYESKSGGIVAAINDMQDKAEETLRSQRREETKKHHAFELQKQSLTDATSTLKEEVEEASANKATTEENEAQANEDLARTTASKEADSKYKDRMSRECATKAQEWEERQQSAAGEQEALAKAREILSSGVKESLVQVDSKVRRMRGAMKNGDLREKLIAQLKGLGRQYNSFALMQAASAAQSDPFVKIRGLIDQMISKLQNQAAEEATHDAFCKEETAKSTKNRDVKTGLVSKHQTRIDKAKSATAQLKQEVQDLQDEIGEITNSKSKAAEIRNKENAEYKKASADYKASAEAVTHAIEVMREFYGDKQASLLQSSVPAPAFGGARSDSSNGIVSFLEVAQSDFTRLLAEAEATESEAADAFQKLSQDAQVSLATKKADVKGKESEIKSLHVALSNSENDLETSSKELDAVLEYLEKLRPQCTSKAQTYEERKAKRDAEIAGLKDALEILNGEAPAFLQRK